MLSALLFWIIVGLIAGASAKFAMPGDDPGGIISHHYHRHCRSGPRGVAAEPPRHRGWGR